MAIIVLRGGCSEMRAADTHDAFVKRDEFSSFKYGREGEGSGGSRRTGRRGSGNKNKKKRSKSNKK